MNTIYSSNLKKKLCEDICLHHASTSKIASDFNIPLKTLENWVTSFNKDTHCFDTKVEFVNNFNFVDVSSNPPDYDNLSPQEFKDILMKKDIEIARLKKNYLVKEGGMGQKVFISFSKKNTK